MAKKASGTQNGDTGASTGTTKPTRPRVPRVPGEALSLDKTQKAVLFNMLLDAPGHYTTAALAQALAGHSAFASLATALASPKAPEKLRQQIKKMAKAAEKRGVRIELKSVRGSSGDYDSVVDSVLRARGQGQVQGQQTTFAAAPVAPAATAFPGLIPVPSA